MNVLVLGGTRLLGKTLVRRLAGEGHDVTVVSRSSVRPPRGVRFIRKEREEGLAELSGRRFDAVFDFIAYNGRSVRQVQAKLRYDLYVLISTIWLTRLSRGIKADQPVGAVDPACVRGMPPVTYDYLLGKMDAERELFEMRKKRLPAVSLRLPIFFGAHEHTGRLAFYVRRIMDGGPVILVDKGLGRVQAGWTEDLAKAMVKWMSAASERPIWEALPAKSVTVREFLSHIARCLRKKPEFICISRGELGKSFPEYPANAPLWRERYLRPTKNNLFSAARLVPTAPGVWLGKIIGLQKGEGDLELRAKEKAFLKGRRDA